jgi:xanthine dehydrogenase YagR molybdenum-binding subunit
VAISCSALDAPIEAAALVEAAYESEPFSVTLDAPGTETINQADTPLKNFFPEVIAGDADQAFAEAPVKIDATYACPPPSALGGASGLWPQNRCVRTTNRLLAGVSP